MEKLTYANFVARCHKKFNNKYDYSKTTFTSVRDLVTITCPIHGDFKQTVKQHLYHSRVGCTACGYLQCHQANTKTTKLFVTKAKTVHNNYYTYNNTNYTKSSAKVIITCPIHGDFEQRAAGHLSGDGCKSCGYQHHSATMLLKPNFWTYTAWELRGKNSPNFVAYTLYIIKCWNDTEEFIKIGKTFVNVQKRFAKTNEMPYNYTILHTVSATAKLISAIETQLHSQLKAHSYKPKTSFRGDSECFTVNSIYNNTTKDS